ncbi:MAG: hypothetical protein KC800_20485 [Candidatus Eremiobacteraeota bacterium]|nr:hypothetical protein [Candidatus Eremiobacteraeota bacterium]
MSARSEWSGYKPEFIDDLDEFLRVHRKTLKNVVGRELLQVWVPWHSDWNTRWVDGPIVLEFQAFRLELEGACCQFSVAVDSLDMDAPLPGPLVWVHNSPEFQPERFVGSQVTAVNALSYDDGDRIAGLEFTFNNGETLNIFDNGDETGISVGKIGPETLFAVAFS